MDSNTDAKLEAAEADVCPDKDVKISAKESEPQNGNGNEVTADGVAKDGEAEAKGEEEINAVKKKLGKKRKIALYVGYYGASYQGMQRNPGAYTVEDVLEESIYKAGGISDDNKGVLQKISWSRAARTDKGVSAACNVVSLKMVLDPPGMIERINEHLPKDVRAFGYFRVTNGFMARNICDRRRYGYVLPLWALDSTHSLDANKRRKVSENQESVGEGGRDEAAEHSKSTEELVSKFHSILQQFVGTQNFHSFSKGVTHDQAQAKRYIIHWKVDSFEHNGATFVKCEVLGQSFLYHQIRKMIGMALAVIRNVAPENCVGIALRSKHKFNVPVAPEFPLYLEECVFNAYNKRFGSDHEKLSRDKFMDDINNFKRTVIDKNIIESEEFDEGILAWLRQLTDELHLFTKWEQMEAEDPKKALAKESGTRELSRSKEEAGEGD